MLQFLAKFGPLYFAFGFIWPLSTQIIDKMGWTPPFGLSAFMAGLIIAAALGLFAQVRGSWIWLKH